jgi:hypothetical protein
VCGGQWASRSIGPPPPASAPPSFTSPALTPSFPSPSGSHHPSLPPTPFTTAPYAAISPEEPSWQHHPPSASLYDQPSAFQPTVSFTPPASLQHQSPPPPLHHPRPQLAPSAFGKRLLYAEEDDEPDEHAALSMSKRRRVQCVRSFCAVGDLR